MKPKIAVLGAGRWGTHLVRIFWEHPEAELIAVVDPHRDRLTAVQERFNLSSDVTLAADWHSIRDQTEVDALIIATPAVTHYTLIQEALHAGYHVLAEKPLTLEVKECLELCQLAQQQKRLLMVDHTYLFHPVVVRGQEVVQSGQLGELRYGYAARTNLGPVRQDVDALWDLAIHDIAIFNTWLGESPVEVQARGQVWLQTGDGKGTAAQLGRPNPSQGLADFVYVTLTYATGFQAVIHLCWLNPDKQRRLGVVGSQGTLVFDEMQTDAPLTLHRGYFDQKGESFIPAGLSREVIDIVPGEPLRLVCDRFLTHLQDPQLTLVSSGWVGAELVQILNGLSQSLAQDGTPVSIPKLSRI